MRARHLLAAALVTITAVVVSGCSSGGGSEALTVYSGRNEELIAPLIDMFSEETGIDVDVRYGDSADLALLIDVEGDSAPADVFLSQSPGAIGFLDVKGRLRELGEDSLDLVESKYRADDGHWVGVSARVRVLVYNPDLVAQSDLPTSVFDLTAPKYKGKIALAPTNGSFQDFITAMRDLSGDARTRAWLEGMHANEARSYANNLAIVDAVGRGEIAMGLVNHYYQERAKAENPNIAAKNFFFSDGDVGSLILVTAVGILDTAEDTDAAEQFVAFLLSKKAQRFHAKETFEYPLARGVEPATDLPPLADIVSPRLNLSELGGGLEATRRMIAQSGLEQS